MFSEYPRPRVKEKQEARSQYQLEVSSDNFEKRYMGGLEKKILKNEAQQAAENSSDDDIDDGVKSENEAESKPSVVNETLNIHEPDENLELLGEVYHIVKGGERWLLNSCLRQKSALGNTILHIAAWYGNNEVVDEVAKLAPHLLFKFNSNKDSALHVAARAGHIPTLQKLLMAYTSKRVQVASEWIKYLDDVDIDMGDVSPDEFNEDEQKQTFALIKLIEVKNKQGNIVLHEAMMSSSNMATMIFQILEPYGKKQDYKGRSLSMFCYESALNEENEANESVLYLAVEAGHTETVIQILDKCSQDVMPKGKLPFLPAIVKKDKGMLSTILFKKPEWTHLMDKQERLPLHYAASFGYYEGVVDLLEKCNSCIIQRDIYGYFPLHMASREGHVDVVKKLLEYCPDPTEMLDNYGRNVLHIAAKSGMLYVVRYILIQTGELEKLINQKDNDGNTPLHLATRKCHPKIVYALTWDHRVDLDVVNRNKQTPLDIANAIYQFEKENPSLRQRLTWTALKSAGAKRSPSKMLPITPSNSKSNEKSRKTEPSKEKVSKTEPLKDRVQTLMLVSTLIITASVTACFSVPGEAEGKAHNLNHAMFQFFIFCITISLFSSISSTIILFWAQLGEIRLLAYSLELSMPLLGVALVSLSLAFLGGVYSVIRKLSWLASTFVVITVIFVLIVLFLYILLFLPSPSTNKALRYMSYYPFIFLASLAENHHTNKF